MASMTPLHSHNWSRREVLKLAAGIAAGNLVAPRPALAQTPKAGGILRMAEAGDPFDLDVHTNPSWLTSNPMQFVYSGLIKHVEDPGKFGEFRIVGDLAESWEQTDRVTYVFHLRKGVRFHNLPPVNGRELTAEDVKFSFERIMTPKPQFIRGFMFSVVDKIETLDRYTVKFTLRHPHAPFLMYVANPNTLIVPKEVGSMPDGLKSAAIGTGPFFLEKWEKGIALRFRKHPQYFLSGRPHLDGIDWLTMPDAAARLASLRSGQLDIEDVAYSSLNALRRSNPELVVEQYPAGLDAVIGFQTQMKPLNDVRVRQAIQLTIKPEDFIGLVAQGQGRRNGVLQWWLTRYALPESELPKRDLGKAKRLLAEAGYPNGFKLVATVMVVLDSTRLAEVLKGQLKELGIDLELEVLPTPDWVRKVRNQKDFQIFTVATWAYEDPDLYVGTRYHSKGTNNTNKISDPKLDELIERQAQELDLEKRRSLIHDMQRRILELVPEIHIYSAYRFSVRQPYVKGFHPMASWPAMFRQFADVWIDR